ncbi:MAG TPA: PLDc N-terminal domain-containing protein [Gammaproteobacteria bacterium]|nr:PLDc N-terminal domain-containing protein [Gammaproteobacteria bacterium]
MARIRPPSRSRRSTHPPREPASRIAWVVVIVALPAFGMLIYLFFGEVKLGRSISGFEPFGGNSAVLLDDSALLAELAHALTQ